MSSALLDEVLDAHGGLAGWRSTVAIRARARTGGLLPRMRFPGDRLADYEIRVELAEQRATLQPFLRGGERALFDRGRVRIERDDGEVLASRDDPRPAFSGLSGLRRNFRWDGLDIAYFAGYAIWNYLTTPYLLARKEIALEQGETWSEEGETWRRLEVTFPPDIHTHSRRQTFYVDERGHIRRHDYVAEPVGRWARAAHYCDAPREFGGLLFPTRRRVRPIGLRGRSLPGPTLVAVARARGA